MKKVVIILFALLALGTMYSQEQDNFSLNYTIYGLGSNHDDDRQIISIEGTKIRTELLRAFPLSEIGKTTDTSATDFFIYDDTVYIRKTEHYEFPQASIDSITTVLTTMKTDIINKTNPNVRSGSFHKIIISNGTTLEKTFNLYNNYDSTALQIVNIILHQLPKNIVTFIPFELWELDRMNNSRHRIIPIKKENQDSKPIDRRKEIERVLENELKLKESED